MNRNEGPSALSIGLGVLGLCILLCFGSCAGVGAWIWSLPPSGVRLSGDLRPDAREYIENKGLLESDESVVAYFDKTMYLTQSNVYILTDRRLLHHQKPETVAIRLKNVEGIDKYPEELGTVLRVETREGRQMKISIAPFNQGKLFEDALREQWNRVRPEGRRDDESAGDETEGTTSQSGTHTEQTGRPDP